MCRRSIVDELIFTTDMLHERTDFPPGLTRYTAGWRAVGASLSDIAAMGGEATAAVAVYAAPEFNIDELRSLIEGARDVCELTDSHYVGGVDQHEEFTVATSAIGRTETPTLRSTAHPGDAVCVTGMLGRTGAALELFEQGARERANELFQFEPRVSGGRALVPFDSAMMDSSNGLARSLHQLAEANDCGFAVEWGRFPLDDTVREFTTTGERELGLYTGEDFELLFTVPRDRIGAARDAVSVPVSVVGDVTNRGVTIDGESLPDRGYTHGR